MTRNKGDDGHRACYREQAYANYGKIFQDTRETFDDIAANRWGRAYKYYLKGWLPKDSSASIGELACGNGRLLHFFIQNGYSNLQGVDISNDQIAISQQVLPSVEQGNVLDWLKNKQNAFDLLVALDLVEHFNRDEVLTFLELCHSALKPKGRLILQTPNADSPFGFGQRYNDITHELAFNENLLSRLLRLKGFTQIQSREQGPIFLGYSLASSIRFITWKIIRAGLQVWNISETGKSMPILTRVFVITGIRE